MPFKNRDKQRAAARAWHHRNKETRNAYMREYRKRIRMTVIQMLGGKCVYCGCDVPEALEINHKNGKGTVEATKRQGGRSSTALYMDILQGRRGTDDLELACMICNAWHRATKLMNIIDGWKISWSPPQS